MVNYISDVTISIMEPLFRLWESVINTLPGVIAAILILIVGYIIALVVSYVVAKVLNKINFDRWVLEKTKLSKSVGKLRLTHFLAVIVKWYVFILFLPSAANLIQLRPLATFFLSVSLWIPNVIVAVILGMVGIVAAMYIERKIVETKAKAAGLIGSVAKWLVYLFTLLIVLDQVGVKIAVAQSGFLIILGGIVLALAMALGIGFGFAFKEEAKKIIKHVKKNI